MNKLFAYSMILASFWLCSCSSIEKSNAETSPFDCALYLASTIENTDEKNDLLASIVHKCNFEGQYDWAIIAAETMNNDCSKVWAFDEIKDYLKDENKALHILAQAFESAKAIDNPYWKTRSLNFLASSYIEIGQKEQAGIVLSQALETVASIDDPIEKVWELTKTADIFIELGEDDTTTQILSEALEDAKKIKNPSWETRALNEIAVVFIRIGKYKKSCRILSEALKVAKTITGSEREASDKSGRITDIAIIYVKMGKHGKVIELMNEIKDSGEKARSLVNISDAYLKKGQNAEATKVLTQALDFARMIDADSGKAYLLTNIADNYIRAGKHDQANLISGKMKNSAEDEVWRLIRLADRYIENKHIGKAHVLLSQAIEASKKIEYAGTRASALRDITNSYAIAGEYTYAKKTANTIKNKEEKVDALAAIAYNYINAKHQDKAIQFLAYAVKEAAGIESINGKVRAFTDIADLYAELDRKDKASQLLLCALETSTKLDEIADRASCLAEIAITYKKCGLSPSKSAKEILSEIIKKIQNHL
jgi:tetratricopeptide (TPR) repeat protein